MSAGAFHSCALLADGTVDCWGNNASGELGDGTAGEGMGRVTPAPVPGLSGVQSVVAAVRYTCAVLTGGTIDCWGDDSYGQLGFTGGTSPSPIPVFGLTGVQSVAAAEYHTCALLSDGTVDCWGGNSSGQLGDGTTTDHATPEPVSGLSGVTSIAVGENHTCALISDGTVDCWGDNYVGEIGARSYVRSSPLPLPVAGLSNVTAIRAGGWHTCAVLADGTLDCWGSNDFGQATTTLATRTAWSPNSVLSGVASVSAAYLYTCARLTNGMVECWGNNSTGQLGDGTTVDHPSPMNVPGLAGVMDITAGALPNLGHPGDGRACALLASGVVDCWGGGVTSMRSPTPVAWR